MAQIDSLGDSGGGVIILGWVGAIATTLAIRPAYLRTVTSGFEHDRREAEQRLHDRKEALEICQRNPALALELGIAARIARAPATAGLVDVNHALRARAAHAPGVDHALAQRIDQTAP